MATRVKKRAPDILDEPAVKGDLEKFVEQVKANPVLYGACAAFIALCLVAGLIYRSSATSASQGSTTLYARAVAPEDASARVAELEPLSQGKGDLAAESSYMLGESAYEAKEYEKAKEAFERVRTAFSSTPYAPDAVEGLGYIAESESQYDKALAAYNEIMQKWPGSFTCRRQNLNVGRCQEQLGNLPGAVAAYQSQCDQFPGSTFEKSAKAALERLKKSNPELFPKAEGPPKAAAPEAEPKLEISAPEPSASAPAPEEKPAAQ